MDELLEKLRKFRDERDWQQFHTPKNLAISVSVEAGELLELFQWQNAEEPITPKLLACLEGEVADVLLYLLLLCDSVGLNLVAAAEKKIGQNEQRFPADTARGIAKPKDVTKSS